MENSSAYIPIDRRFAILSQETIPQRMQGAALFADISGFTNLSEAMERELGPKRGAEEVSAHLNRVYDALVAEVHRYRGSVISFSGDAITCWFDEDDGRRAITSGLRMLKALTSLQTIRTQTGRVISLGLKVGVACGQVRRFLVGDPDYIIMDAMTGSVLDSIAVAESLAERGDLVLSPAVAASMEKHLQIKTWRVDPATGSRYAVVTGFDLKVPETPWIFPEGRQLSEEDQYGWLLPPVLQRLRSGQGMFLADLRPAVALFLSFGGIDYDQDEAAPEKLDGFIKQVEHILERYEGHLLQLTIGDKGTYLYAAFGAPIAHEDEAIRAGAAALELMAMGERLLYLENIKIGITVGRMRTGAYGAVTRRTYGVLGDAVNLSARLMQAAAAGQILVNDTMRRTAEDMFLWERRDAVKLKGKAEPVAVSRLVGLKKQRRIRLQEPKYSLPMVGRAPELARLRKKIDQVLIGRGQIVGITAEAGMGKSRLAAEAIRIARDRGLEGYGGECQSYGTDNPYLVWQGVWRGFFDLDAAHSLEQQVMDVQMILEDVDPSLVGRLPLLGPVLNLTIPDNDLTASLDARVRKASLEALLVTLLRTRPEPLLIVLEDCHWLDNLSRDLIEEIGRVIVHLPILLLLVYRPPDTQRLQMPRIDRLAHFTEIELADFTDSEAAALIQLKLQQFFGNEHPVPKPFAAEITRRSAGNPFYIEEILNYLNDRGIDPSDSEVLTAVDLPDSIYSLILARIDQLNERQQITIRIASVIGRLFKAAMVWGVYPELGQLRDVEADLDILSTMELTPLDTPDPEMTYLFKHIMTQEVAYESLLFETRCLLHEQIGFYIERTYRHNLDRYLPLLAYHFDHTDNEHKRRTYLLKAGIAAQTEYANTAALNHFNKVLPLLPSGEQIDVMVRQGEVLEVMGMLEEAEAKYNEALSLAVKVGNPGEEARAQISIGELRRKQGDFDEASSWYASAQAISEQYDDRPGIAKALICAGTLANTRGKPGEARILYDQSLEIRRELDDKKNIANVLNNLGIVARSTGEYVQARAYHEEALEIRRELRGKWAIAASLNNLGNVLVDLGDLGEARRCLEEAVNIQREVGHKWFLANALNNLGNVTRELSNLKVAGELYEESIHLNFELGDQWALAYLLEDVGSLIALRDQSAVALQLSGAADGIRQEIGSPLSPVEKGKLDRALQPVRKSLSKSEADTAWDEGKAMSLNQAVAIALSQVGGVTANTD